MKHLIVSCLFIALTTQASPDVYWRPYNSNAIPPDAVVGSFDGKSYTYIGNAPLWYDNGLLVGQIFSGQDFITITSDVANDENMRMYQRHFNIQILCSSQKNKFEWVTTNSTSLSRVQNLVRGGYQSYPIGDLYIGRVVHNGLKIGKVVGYMPNKANLFIPDGENEIQYSKFEVLTYTG